MNCKKLVVIFITCPILLSACSAPSTPDIAPPQTPASEEITEPIPTTEPTVVTTPSPTIEPAVESVSYVDPPEDLFDKSGNPTNGQSYLDIVGAEITTSESDYIVDIELGGPLPTETDDPQILLEWTVYLDTDNDPSNGDSWPLITNDLRFEYMARLLLLDATYRGQLLDISTGKPVEIQYSIAENIIQLSWPKTIIQADVFRYVIAAKKYGERGAGSAFILADKLPNDGHCCFPELLDNDEDGFSNHEETDILGSNPNVAEDWGDLALVTNILDTPKKICVYLDRKFTNVTHPSQLFTVPVEEIFREMAGDCDEFAILAIYWLESSGYETYMVQVRIDSRMVHDVCAYKDNDSQWYCIDLYYHQTGLNPIGPFGSIDEICDHLPAHYGASDWVKYNLYDSDGNLVNTKVK